MAWHKTCAQPWQYVVAMDMVAAGLRPHKKGVQPKPTNKNYEKPN